MAAAASCARPDHDFISGISWQAWLIFFTAPETFPAAELIAAADVINESGFQAMSVVRDGSIR